MLLAQRRVPPPFQLLPQFLQLADQTSALGFAVDPRALQKSPPARS